MSGIRYPEEFKIEAVKQVTDRGYKIGEVAKRLGVTPKRACMTGSRNTVIPVPSTKQSPANKMSCDSSRLSFEESRRSGIY